MEISLPDELISLQKKNISLTIYVDFRLRGLLPAQMLWIIVPQYGLATPWLRMPCRSGNLTLLQTREYWRTCKSLPVARLVTHQWDSSYQDLLQLYQLPSHEECRLHLKRGLMFKIVHNLCYYPDIPSFRDNIHRRAAHAFQFKLPFASSNAYYFSYFPFFL